MSTKKIPTVPEIDNKTSKRTQLKNIGTVVNGGISVIAFNNLVDGMFYELQFGALALKTEQNGLAFVRVENNGTPVSQSGLGSAASIIEPEAAFAGVACVYIFKYQLGQTIEVRAITVGADSEVLDPYARIIERPDLVESTDF